MRIAICHPQTPFSRGGAEMHTEGLARALGEAGHDVDVVGIPFKWYPPEEIAHQMALWRSLDLSESNGQRIDMVIALKFPAYLIRHERKVVWLIHQHRTAYELWDHPAYGDLRLFEDGRRIRDLIWRADRVGLEEAKRVFTNSENVRERLRRSVGVPGEALYHRSPLSERLADLETSGHGDYVVFPSRIEPLKRQTLAVEAMRHVRSDVRLVLIGTGPQEEEVRGLVERSGLGGRVEVAGRVSDERLLELYRGALGALYVPFDEDYGYVTLEAMAARRAVITTTDSGGPLELVTHGENGLVAGPEARTIAAALDELRKDPRRAEALGDAGRRTFEERVPPWPEVVSRLLA